MNEIQILFLQQSLEKLKISELNYSHRILAIERLLIALENEEPAKGIAFVLGCLSLWRQENIRNLDRKTAEKHNEIISDIMESIELPLSDESEKQIQLFQTKKYEANRNRRRSFLPNK